MPSCEKHQELDSRQFLACTWGMTHQKTPPVKRSLLKLGKRFQVEVHQSDPQHLFSFTKRFHGFIVLAGLVEFFALIPKRLDFR